MSINRLIFIVTSVLRAPSTLQFASMTDRMRATSLSERAFTLRSGSTPASFNIFLDVVKPIPKIYVKAASIRFSLGRSTPAIRATLSPFQNIRIHCSSLPLFVTGIRADHADHTFSLDNLTLSTHFFHRRADFHFSILTYLYL